MSGAASAQLEHDRELRGVAEALRDAMPRLPSGYRPGQTALVETIARLAGVSRTTAETMLAELMDLGLVKYDAGGRGIGAAGVWTYPRSPSVRPRTPVRRRPR